MSHKTITLDVREDIRTGREPFARIMATATRLGADEQLLLIAPFEPVPLFTVLATKGFTHQAKATESGDWEVLFTRGGEGRTTAEGRNLKAGTQNERAPRSPAAPEFLDVDARGLEPPQPMVKILEALATLPAEMGLRARTDRRPMHLYPHLESRGFAGETEEQSDGSFITNITRR
jgi:uncharacterized protein (DUF2249 family)